MPTSNAEELGLFLKCTVIGRGVFGPCACCTGMEFYCITQFNFLALKRLVKF